MSENTNRGAAEENAGVPYTSGEDNGPASPSSLPGNDDAVVDGAAEEQAGVTQADQKEDQDG